MVFAVIGVVVSLTFLISMVINLIEHIKKNGWF